MKFGFRTPSFKKRIAARTSWKRFVRHSLGIKAPRGWGWLTNPRKAAYNRVYNRTTVDPLKLATKGAGRKGHGWATIVIGAVVAFAAISAFVR